MSDNEERAYRRHSVVGGGHGRRSGLKPVRIHFGIESFGVNAWVARVDGEPIIERHSETEESGTQHEELYLVTRGHATFQVDDETIEAPAGTFVRARSGCTEAIGRSKGTTVLALGAARGEVSLLGVGARARSVTTAEPTEADGGEPVDLWMTLQSHGLVELPPMQIDPETRRLDARPRRRARPAPGQRGARTEWLRARRDDQSRRAFRRSEPADSHGHILRLDEDLTLLRAGAL